MEENQANIPEGWLLTSFGDRDLFRIIGSGIKHFNGEKEYYSTSSIDGNRILLAEQLITYKNRPSRANMQPIENSVWFAKMKNTFKILKATNREIEEVILSTGFSGIESIIVDCDYLMQILSSSKFNSQKNLLAEGSTQEAVNNTKIKEIKFLLPENPTEQTQIATILTKVDEAITQTEQLIAKYTRIKTGLMQDLLTKGIDENGNIRSEETHEFKDSPLGRIPKEWEWENLENLLDDLPNNMRSGPFGSSLTKSEWVEAGIPYLGIDNVFRERFVKNYKRFITPEKFRQLEKYAVRPKDVMITIMGTVGRSCVVPDDVGDAISSKHVWTMTFDKNKYISELISYQLNYSSWILKVFSEEAQGGIMSSINSKTLKNLIFPQPSIKEQLRIWDIMKKQDTSLFLSEDTYFKLNSLKTGLMQDLLSGQVRVNHLIKETANV